MLKAVAENYFSENRNIF